MEQLCLDFVCDILRKISKFPGKPAVAESLLLLKETHNFKSNEFPTSDYK